MTKVKLIISEPWDATLPNGSISAIFILHDEPLFFDAKVAYYKMEPVTSDTLIGQEFSFLIVAKRHTGPNMIGTLNTSTSDIPVAIAVPKSLKVGGISDCVYRFIGTIEKCS